MSNELKDLLNYVKDPSGDYLTGVALLAKHSKNKILIRSLTTKQHPEKLKRELNKILQKHGKKKTPSSAPTEPTRAQPGTDRTGIDQDAAEISQDNDPDPIAPADHFYLSDDPDPEGIEEQILTSRRLMYRKRGHLHGKLHQAATNSERFELCREIYLLQIDIDKLNTDLAAVRSGEIPFNYLKTSRSLEEYLRIKNLKLYVSRYKRKLKTARTLKEKNRIQAHLDKYQKELNALL